jgi:branched-chain amino acid transport system substrate-binding protein
MRRFAFAALALTTLSTFACSTRPSAYLIGAAAPQELDYGIQTNRGIMLAVEEINRNGGINGVPLRVVNRDDQASSVTAVKIASEFTADPAILAVVGHASSAAMLSAAPVYDAGRLVALATAPSSPDLTGISPWVFRMITSDSVNGMTLAAFASSFSDSLGRPVRAAILYTNDAYGRGLSEAFQRHFQGRIISADPVSETSDFEPFIAYLKLQDPDIVFVASDERVGLAILQEAKRQSFTTRFLGGDGWHGVAQDSSADGVYIGVPFTAQRVDANTNRFIKEFRVKFGTLPTAHAALAYDATHLIARAMLEGGAKRTAIRAYLSGLTKSNAFQGTVGSTYFAETNDPVGNHFQITRVRSGQLFPIRGAP